MDERLPSSVPKASEMSKAAIEDEIDLIDTRSNKFLTKTNI